jgi:glycosyltransferase involved in cell wall biosynthesis
MTLCHVVSHIDEEASGPSYSVPRLAQAVAAAQEQEVVVATLDRGAGKRDLGIVKHRVFLQSRFPRKLGVSGPMRSWLGRAREHRISLIHSHGLWMMPNIYPAYAAARAGVPHVIAPRGALDPAALVYSPLVKQAVRLLGQNGALKGATAFHATSEVEAGHIRAQGLRQPIILSPNGIDIPDTPRPPRGPRRTLLYLGRLHEKKGLDMLLQAWTALEPAHPDWDLRIVGKGSEGFEARLAQNVAARGLTRVALDGPVYAADKLAAYQQADLLVLPTRGENFGMVVAEALAAGTPVVTTTGAPWAGLKEQRAGWWCAAEAPAIQATLTRALAADAATLTEMGARGRAWMIAAYGWDEIGVRLVRAYSWLELGLSRAGPAPDDILID